MPDVSTMVNVVKSETFDRWLRRLRDARAVARIAARIDRLAAGNPGDARPVKEAISEMRVDYGPGYRLYFMRGGPALVILLCGGDKSTQRRDVATAHAIAAQWRG
jgi:putative addiction module killer protein